MGTEEESQTTEETTPEVTETASPAAPADPGGAEATPAEATTEATATPPVSDVFDTLPWDTAASGGEFFDKIPEDHRRWVQRTHETVSSHYQSQLKEKADALLAVQRLLDEAPDDPKIGELAAAKEALERDLATHGATLKEREAAIKELEKNYAEAQSKIASFEFTREIDQVAAKHPTILDVDSIDSASFEAVLEFGFGYEAAAWVVFDADDAKRDAVDAAMDAGLTPDAAVQAVQRMAASMGPAAEPAPAAPAAKETAPASRRRPDLVGAGKGSGAVSPTARSARTSEENRKSLANAFRR
jgi:hypothetical protein